MQNTYFEEKVLGHIEKLIGPMDGTAKKLNRLLKVSAGTYEYWEVDGYLAGMLMDRGLTVVPFADTFIYARVCRTGPLAFDPEIIDIAYELALMAA